MAGDIILKIDSSSAASLTPVQVSARLRGAIGEKVVLTIQRPGIDAPFTVPLPRREIVINDVGHAGFVAPGVAYASLDGFSDKAAVELQQSIKKMQSKGKIKKFILDLRGNPGGLLEAAVDVVNIFVPADQLVVYTKGYHEKRIEFKTDKAPLLPDVPLAVIVNGGSASASEIVTGALQDMDRAVIVGQPTFGKGLVQKVFTIDKQTNTRIKITTAKYYIPSGRSIQKRDYSKNSALVRLNTADSLLHNGKHNAYFTENRRQVFDKGGIYPDVAIEGDSLNSVMMQLARSYAFFDFTVDLHHKIVDKELKEIDDKTMFKTFNSWLSEHNITISFPGQEDIDDLKKIISARENAAGADGLLAQLQRQMQRQTHQDFEQSENEIVKYLQLELAEKRGGRAGREAYTANHSKEVRRAIQILDNESGYDRILAHK